MQRGVMQTWVIPHSPVIVMKYIFLLIILNTVVALAVMEDWNTFIQHNQYHCCWRPVSTMNSESAVMVLIYLSRNIPVYLTLNVRTISCRPQVTTHLILNYTSGAFQRCSKLNIGRKTLPTVLRLLLTKLIIGHSMPSQAIFVVCLGITANVLLLRNNSNYKHMDSLLLTPSKFGNK